ncbi:hypothetical protein F25303_7314 [Fusarium sp. NRRL 25303]|nr:hypothetical protein F25303_7314 [Fusarium sp. NRRL 25303]
MAPRVDIYRRGRQLNRLRKTGHVLLNSLLHNDDLHYFTVCGQRFPDPHEERFPAEWVNSDRKKLRRMLKYWRQKMEEKYCFTVVNGTRQLKARGRLGRSTRLMRRSGNTYTEDSDLPSPQEEDMNEYLRSEREAIGDHDYYNDGEEG